MNVRGTAVGVLRALRLNRPIGKFYYAYVHGFAPAGGSLPAAVERAFNVAASRGVLHGSDYCEFGVFKGYTFLHAHNVGKRLGTNMRYFGFDSFEGLPAPTAGDVTSEGYEPFYKGQYAQSLEAVTKELDRRGVDWSRTHLVRGYFDESLNRQDVIDYKISKVSVALVDCDLYSSTVDVLEFLDTRMIDGTVLLMDDWKSFGDDERSGQPRALAEFERASRHWRFEHLYDYGHSGRVFSVERVASRH